MPVVSCSLDLPKLLVGRGMPSCLLDGFHLGRGNHGNGAYCHDNSPCCDGNCGVIHNVAKLGSRDRWPTCPSLMTYSGFCRTPVFHTTVCLTKVLDKNTKRQRKSVRVLHFFLHFYWKIPITGEYRKKPQKSKFYFSGIGGQVSSFKTFFCGTGGLSKSLNIGILIFFCKMKMCLQIIKSFETCVAISARRNFSGRESRFTDGGLVRGIVR